MPHILLVDDDADLGTSLQQMLELDGHRVTLVADGQQALAALQAKRGFELVISDMMMPVLDGTQLLSHLARQQPKLPVIAMSGGRRIIGADFCLHTAKVLGALQCLQKPFDRATLQDAVRTALEAPPNQV